MMEFCSPNLAANPSVEIRRVGREKVPVLVIDRCLAEPEQLIDFARRVQQQASSQFRFEASGASFYPGVRCALPAQFGPHLLQQLTPLLRENLMPKSANEKFEHRVSSLSLAGVKKESLRPIQSLPHFDDTRDDQFALVLYLFREDLGGTGFYRHSRTGFERIHRERLAEYAPTLKAEAMAHPEILYRYMGRDNCLFESIEYIAPVFNRAVIYPSNCLHSGLLSNDRTYTLSVAEGRLTANMLFICNEV